MGDGDRDLDFLVVFFRGDSLGRFKGDRLLMAGDGDLRDQEPRGEILGRVPM